MNLNQVISVETNEELKELLKDISVEKSDPSAIDEICKEFQKFGVELPKITRGHGQFIPLTNQNMNHFNEISLIKNKFEKLKIEYTRAKWI